MEFRIASLICAGLLLTGCASPSYTPSSVSTDSDTAAVQLAEAATSVSHSLQQLADIQAAATPPAKGKHLPATNIPGLTQMSSIDWAGPIGQLVERIAASSQYRLRVLGNPPAIPVIVSINSKNKTLGKILRDADFQAGKRANIIVSPSTHVIELRYAHS